MTKGIDLIQEVHTAGMARLKADLRVKELKARAKTAAARERLRGAIAAREAAAHDVGWTTGYDAAGDEDSHDRLVLQQVALAKRQKETDRAIAALIRTVRAEKK